jgi:sugar O-acyltransferase (sialic acid O-acetyltransferase NeuD family)
LSDQFELIGFVDDSVGKQGDSIFGVPITGRELFRKHSDAKVLAVPGSVNNYLIRHEIIEGLKITAKRYATVVHPSASVSQYSSVGRNCLIMAGVCISANAVIGNNVCILPNSIIHHDSKIGDNTLIGGGVVVAGYTSIGKNCYVGSGSTIKNNLKIGDRNLMGMSSNVVEDLGNDLTVMGNPARIYRENPAP